MCVRAHACGPLFSGLCSSLAVVAPTASAASWHSRRGGEVKLFDRLSLSPPLSVSVRPSVWTRGSQLAQNHHHHHHHGGSRRISGSCPPPATSADNQLANYQGVVRAAGSHRLVPGDGDEGYILSRYGVPRPVISCEWRWGPTGFFMCCRLLQCFAMRMLTSTFRDYRSTATVLSRISRNSGWRGVRGWKCHSL